jgi:hypothetical protein
MVVVGGLLARVAVEAVGLAIAIIVSAAVATAGACAWAHGERAYRRDRRMLAAGHLEAHARAVRAMSGITVLAAILALTLMLDAEW